MTGTVTVSLTGETIELTTDLPHGQEITSELTGTEMESLIGKMVGGNSMIPGPQDLGIQTGEEKDGDLKASQ